MKGTAKYLGFYLGTSASAAQWGAPLAKYSDRVQAIYQSGAAISISAYTYNVCVLPVMLYVAQLVPLPREAKGAERKALYQVTHFAGSSLNLSAFFHLDSVGGPKLRSLESSAREAMMRTATQIVPDWP